MEQFNVDSFYKVVFGASPKEADIAIVSINSSGTVGELNTMVLKEYGYNKSILKQLNLAKGFDLYDRNGKPILFIVTVGIGNPINNLNENLKQAIRFHIQTLSGKKIWLPLMATGAGNLGYTESYKITIKVLEELKNSILNSNCQFIISLSNDKKGEDFYKQIKEGFDNSISSDEHNKFNSKIQIDSVKNNTRQVNNLIKYLNANYYFVGIDWDGKNQTERFYKEEIWETGYNDRHTGIIKNILVDDILIIKEPYTIGSKEYTKIIAIGKVTKNPMNGINVNVNWIVKNLSFEIETLGYNNSTITSAHLDSIKEIFSKISINDLKKIRSSLNLGKKKLYEIVDDLEEEKTSDSTLKQEEKKSEIRLRNNHKNIAGLHSDTDTGADYFEISKDVNAFARVMAAKSFEPPLAIALLGKWGSGKSFFMRKLKEGIVNLSEENPEGQFCEGIAHVHFNAWSYMDANLWASFVTRIFEKLDDYIKNTFSTEKEIKNIESQLFNKLHISKEQLNNLNKQKEAINNNIQKLQTTKDKLKNQLNKKIAVIKTKTLTDIIEKVDTKFNVRNQIEITLENNPTFVKTKEKFIKIVPEKYWDNPTEFYNQLKSSYSFFKAFFHRDNIWKNILWITVIVLIVTLTPIITYLLNLLISWHDFTITNGQWLTISIIGSTFVRGVDTFLKLKKQIAPFWKIKEDYESKKANALFEFEQEEKALILEIDNFKQELTQIDSQIQLNREIKATLEFKLKNALSTEALYTFIEKRANSEDYKKHLGIVSLIRKDFEILSGLLTNHQTELVTNKESEEFKKLFGDKKPLERIILYIDDLDRCPEERVVEVLEAVNLLMAFPLFVVVVGVDPRWVKNALIKKHYLQFTGVIGKVENKEIEVIEASSYLEKIFQVAFHLKDAGDESIKKMIKTLAQVKPSIFRISNSEPPLIESPDEEPEFEPDFVLTDDSKIKNKNGIDTSLIDNLYKKETIEALDISEKECELLQDMSEIIGNNPRAVKRFINIYRIIKTHENFEYDKTTEEKELMVIMFLLALSMGDYKDLVSSFEHHINHGVMNQRPISDYFNTTGDVSDYLFDEKAKKLKGQLRHLLSIKLIKLYKIETDLFAIHYPFIKRFTFKNI